MAVGTYTLTEIARRLGAEQHRLIHLCEKEVVEPDLQDADGRGTSRLFSARNVLEFAIALRLRRLRLPLAGIRAILYVVRSFEDEIRRSLRGFALPEALREASAPDLRVIVSEGEEIYLTLGKSGSKPKLYGGIPMQKLLTDKPSILVRVGKTTSPSNKSGSLGPEGSRYVRLELSITQLARDLPLD